MSLDGRDLLSLGGNVGYRGRAQNHFVLLKPPIPVELRHTANSCFVIRQIKCCFKCPIIALSEVNDLCARGVPNDVDHSLSLAGTGINDLRCCAFDSSSNRDCKNEQPQTDLRHLHNLFCFGVSLKSSDVVADHGTNLVREKHRGLVFLTYRRNGRFQRTVATYAAADPNSSRCRTNEKHPKTAR